MPLTPDASLRLLAERRTSGPADHDRHRYVRRDRVHGRAQARSMGFDNVTGSDISSSASTTSRRPPGTRRGPTTIRTSRAPAWRTPRVRGLAHDARLLPGPARVGDEPDGSSREGRAAARLPRPLAFGLGSSPPARRRSPLRPRMAMTYRLFAPVGRFVVASTFLTACAASPPPRGARRARRAPQRPRPLAAGAARAAVPAVVSAAADWNAPPTNGSPGVDVAEAVWQRAARKHRLRGQAVRPVDDVVHGARRPATASSRTASSASPSPTRAMTRGTRRRATAR